MPSTGEAKSKLNRRQNRIRGARLAIEAALQALEAARRELPVLAEAAPSAASPGAARPIEEVGGSVTASAACAPSEAASSSQPLPISEASCTSEQYRLLMGALEMEGGELDDALQDDDAAWAGLQAIFQPIGTDTTAAGGSEVVAQAALAAEHGEDDHQHTASSEAERIDLSSNPRSWSMEASSEESDASGDEDSGSPHYTDRENVQQLLAILDPGQQQQQQQTADVGPTLPPRRLNPQVRALIVAKCHEWLREAKAPAQHSAICARGTAAHESSMAAMAPAAAPRSQTAHHLPTEEQAAPLPPSSRVARTEQPIASDRWMNVMQRALECVWQPFRPLRTGSLYN
jgi:hypothetical protein